MVDTNSLDDIYEVINHHLCNTNLNEIDVIIKSLDVKKLSLTLLITYLTVTLPIKNKLSSRMELLKQVKILYPDINGTLFCGL